jgi:purine-binding chemotaxis protein CheW
MTNSIQTAGSGPSSGTAVLQERGQYLTFSLAGETFGMNILNIKEIIEFGNVTQVPMMPGFIQGVINLRGSVVPVVNLSLRFGKSAAPIGKRTCIVIIETSSADEVQDIGVVVDAVNAVLEIEVADIEPPPSFGARLRTDFIAGMAKVDQRFVILINVAKVLSIEDMAAVGMLREDGHEASAVANLDRSLN